MPERHTPTPDTRESGLYEIQLAGHLDARWTAWFDGMTVSDEHDGTTVISGRIADQAAPFHLAMLVAARPPALVKVPPT